MIKLLPLILSLISSTSLAEETTPTVPWYEVEIIIFTHHEQASLTTESFSRQAEPPELINAIELLPPFEQTEEATPLPEIAYQWLTTEQLKLTPQYRTLNKSGDYQLLQHIGWRQPGQNRESASAILIYPYDQSQQLSLHEFAPKTIPFAMEHNISPAPEEMTDITHIDDIEPTDAISQSAEMQQALSHSADTDERPSSSTDSISVFEDIRRDWQQESHVIGTVRLILSRYLHIESDLFLSIPTEMKHTSDHLSQRFTDTAYADYASIMPTEISYLAQQQPPLLMEHHYFRVEERRRIRKGELHYFDHPQFGMLLEVRDHIPLVEEEPITPPDDINSVEHQL